jgi:hypothetical protein
MNLSVRRGDQSRYSHTLGILTLSLKYKFTFKDWKFSKTYDDGYLELSYVSEVVDSDHNVRSKLYNGAPVGCSI